MKNWILISSVFGSLISIGCTISSTMAQINGQSPGKLQGTVIYPSDYLPAQKVCAENVRTKSLFCFETRQEQAEFSISVRPGTYEIFARECNKSYKQATICRDGYRPKRAYYNEFSKCGVTAECGKKFKKNRPIAVRIRSGQTIANIKPHDWYPHR